MLFDWNFHSKSSPSSFLGLFGSYGLIALLCLAFSVVTDYLVFGRWTVNQLNFLRFNLFGGGGSFYGTHPWHWYFTVGLPAILVSQLPVAVIGWLLDVVPKTRGYHWLHAYREPARPLKMQRDRETGIFFGAIIVWTIFAYRYSYFTCLFAPHRLVHEIIVIWF